MHSYNKFIYSRERRRFGRQCLFSDRTQLLLCILPSRKHRLAYILRNPVNQATQLSDQKAHSWVQTENVTHNEHGMYHYEGGWPREVNINDEEQTLRYRKKVEREDNWGVQVNHLINNSLKVAAQNSAVNVYEEFFVDLPPDLCSEIRLTYEARQKNIFHDPSQPSRRITVIDWLPSDIRRFMAQHTNMVQPVPGTHRRSQINLEHGNENSFYIWDLNNPLKPTMVFTCLESICRAMICPKDDNYIAGGLQSGKVTMFNSRTGGMPLRASPLEAAHHEPVPALCWVHSKSNTEFYTGSYDGSVKYWDGRDLSKPLQEIILDPEPTNQQSPERAHGVTVLEFEYTIPVRYIIASDQGHIFIGNRKGMLPTETLLNNYKIFAGPIRTIERNPFFVKNFLIVGDWCAKVWAEECKGSPTTLLVKKKNQMMCGTWSTARCSLFVTGDAAGELDFWDLLLHQRQPVFTAKFNQLITYVKFRPDGKYLAVALENGDTHLLELDEAMKKSGSKDKALVAALFEREQLRCKLLEGRVEEIKLKRKTLMLEEEKRAMEEEKRLTVPELDPNVPSELLQIIEDDYEFKEALRLFTEHTLKVDKKRQEREYLMETTEFEDESCIPENNLAPTLTDSKSSILKADNKS